MFTRRQREINPILKSLLWNVGLFFLMLIFGFFSAWLFYKIGW